MGVALIFRLVRRLRTDFAAGLNVFYCGEFKWLDVRHHHLVTGLHRFQFTGIELFEKMNVTVKLFSDSVGCIAVG